ncbi:MAG TPA: phosphopentomutase [Candidatus Krumholzibacteria bacterium]|nr:phosphopentomutase [Candidatus Krumholzibacteria bacterium]HPD71397.1 phosphopentomutase [Candidatus Krumholzibacteria bacterium]HRY38903.1 phosphopentomutase [Candidatus Krumholzibacteria bacterium]
MARAVLIILDGVGVGRAPDAAAYGDLGSDTLGNLARQVGGLALPNLAALGLGNLHDILGVPPVSRPAAGYGRMREVSAGKDSTTGHWELMGLVTRVPFPTYPDGFPPDLLAEFARRIGRGWLGNVAASGTAIIEALGDEHVRTGKVIVYTSADSVFQVAAHEAIVPLDELDLICRVARELLVPPHGVSRVIARPFRGASGAYERTPNRHDYSVVPGEGLVLPALQIAGVHVRTIGKIYDLYAGQGIDTAVKSRDNADGMRLLEQEYRTLPDPGFLMVNLVDFDMLWGHRNDCAGMAAGLRAFDAWLPRFLAALRAGDLCFITADHGNDPTTPSTDHSREEVPLLAWSSGSPGGADLGLRPTFADLGATVAEFFGAEPPAHGTSVLANLRAAPAKGRR